MTRILRRRRRRRRARRRRHRVRVALAGAEARGARRRRRRAARRARQLRADLGAGKGHRDSRRYSAWTRRSARRVAAARGRAAARDGHRRRVGQPGASTSAFAGRSCVQRGGALAALQAQPGFRRYAVEMLDRVALATAARSRDRGRRRNLLPARWPLQSAQAAARIPRGASPARAAVYAPAATSCASRPHRAVHPRFRCAERSSAEKLVLAAGLGNARLAPMVGPRQRRCGRTMDRSSCSNGCRLFFGAARDASGRRTRPGAHRRFAGRRGLDDALEIDVLAAMAARAVRVFPVLAGVRVVRALGGAARDERRRLSDLRPVAAHPGAFLAPATAASRSPRRTPTPSRRRSRPGALPGFAPVFMPGAVSMFRRLPDPSPVERPPLPVTVDGRAVHGARRRLGRGGHCSSPAISNFARAGLSSRRAARIA